MYITILKFSELTQQIQEKIKENRPDLRLRLDTKDDQFHILENGNVYYEFDLKHNLNKKGKPLPCYTYPQNSFDFTDFFVFAENILEYPDLNFPHIIVFNQDNIDYKLFLTKFNDVYLSFGTEVCHWLLMYRYLKPSAFQNKYQIGRNVAKRILDYFTELNFIKKSRDGWCVTKETEKIIYDKIQEFDHIKENTWIKGEEQKDQETEEMTNHPEEEFLQEELVVMPTNKTKSKKKHN